MDDILLSLKSKSNYIYYIPNSLLSEIPSSPTHEIMIQFY